MRQNRKRDIRIVIVGAGAGGLCMAIQLKKAGFENFSIVEKAPAVGGTWFYNRYPGCACDIPSHLYSYSFDIKNDWSRPYAPQPEILEYLQQCAQKYHVLPHCRFECEVRRATWKENSAQWELDLAAGEKLEADVLISALGMFNDLNFPDIEGLDDFAGERFHSARWNWKYDLAGKHVAVIGSAASAIQFIPEIAKRAGQVDYYQRTANWVLPKEDDPYTEEELDHFRTDPQAAPTLRAEIFNTLDAVGPAAFDALHKDMEAAGRQNIALAEDPEVRAKLTPDHPWGCKRPLFSSDYYQAFNRPNLELVTEKIQRITSNTIISTAGKARAADVLILATGFKTTRYLSAIDVRGRGGVTIQQAWADGAQAYKGVTTAGFPNLFMLYGPNTNSDSLITMIEYHVQHALLHIKRIVDEELAWVDVKPERMAAYNEQLQRDIAGVKVWRAGCTDYYRVPSGRVVTQWPKTMGEHRDLLAELDLDAYEVGE